MMNTDDVNPCKCGHMPEVHTLFPVAKHMYQGIVVCPECGESVSGKQWYGDKDDAAEEAIEEWNEAMPAEDGETYQSCPFCGSDDIGIVDRWTVDHKQQFAVWCYKCDNHSLWFFDREMSIAQWNEINERAKVVKPMEGE